MTLGSKTSRRNAQQIEVQLKGSRIPQSDSIRYLGVRWKHHMAGIRKKFFAAIACIWRASCFLPVSTCKMLYQSLVLPHLDYCSTVLHPCSQVLSQSIESMP